MSDELRKRFDKYIGDLFAQEDDVLKSIRSEIEHHNMPAISVQAFDGYLLQWLMRIVGVRTAVEIGTLGGYSGTWIARALPDDGILYTLELSDKHAQVARGNFKKAGVSHKVEIIVGDAQDTMKQIANSAPFDMVFIDANKGAYLDYLRWAVDHVRPGGMVTAHNTYRDGRVMTPESDEEHIIANFNRALAEDPRLRSIIIPIGDGMAVGIRQ